MKHFLLATLMNFFWNRNVFCNLEDLESDASFLAFDWVGIEIEKTNLAKTDSENFFHFNDVSILEFKKELELFSYVDDGKHVDQVLDFITCVLKNREAFSNSTQSHCIVDSYLSLCPQFHKNVLSIPKKFGFTGFLKLIYGDKFNSLILSSEIRFWLNLYHDLSHGSSTLYYNRTLFDSNFQTKANESYIHGHALISQLNLQLNDLIAENQDILFYNEFSDAKESLSSIFDHISSDRDSDIRKTEIQKYIELLKSLHEELLAAKFTDSSEDIAFMAINSCRSLLFNLYLIHFSFEKTELIENFIKNVIEKECISLIFSFIGTNNILQQKINVMKDIIATIMMHNDTSGTKNELMQLKFDSYLLFDATSLMEFATEMVSNKIILFLNYKKDHLNPGESLERIAVSLYTFIYELKCIVELQDPFDTNISSHSSMSRSRNSIEFSPQGIKYLKIILSNIQQICASYSSNPPLDAQTEDFSTVFQSNLLNPSGILVGGELNDPNTEMEFDEEIGFDDCDVTIKNDDSSDRSGSVEHEDSDDRNSSVDRAGTVDHDVISYRNSTVDRNGAIGHDGSFDHDSSIVNFTQSSASEDQSICHMEKSVPDLLNNRRAFQSFDSAYDDCFRYNSKPYGLSIHSSKPSLSSILNLADRQSTIVHDSLFIQQETVEIEDFKIFEIPGERKRLMSSITGKLKKLCKCLKLRI